METVLPETPRVSRGAGPPAAGTPYFQPPHSGPRCSTPRSARLRQRRFDMRYLDCKEPAEYNTCYGRMLSARLSCLMYHDDLGVYPGQIDDMVRELDLSFPDTFLCPRSKREGGNLRFEYDRPTPESAQTHVLFRTTGGGYVKDGKRGNVGIRLDGQVVLLPDE